MDTTTSEGGATQVAEPVTNEAVTDEGAFVIQNDDNGTPTMVPVSEASNTEAPEVASTQGEEVQAAEPKDEAQATETDEEIVEWAKKKGIEINPENPNEVKLARLQLENDRRFHEAQQNKPKVQVPELLDETEDPTLNAVVQKQNDAELRLYVRDWFDANPEMKQYRKELMDIAAERPYLIDMDDVAAHLYRQPGFVDKIRNEGGRQALENLAQKQAAVPPQAGASNANVYGSENTITPQNVYELIDKNDHSWFVKNYEQINRAIAGK